MQPQRVWDFVGKQLRPRSCELANKPDTLVARWWLKVLTRRWLAMKTTLSTLGKVTCKEKDTSVGGFTSTLLTTVFVKKCL